MKENPPSPGNSAYPYRTLSSNPDISIVLPIYNEEESLPTLLAQILAKTSDQYEILTVDDGSTDSSHKILTNLASQHSILRVLNYGQNRGKGFALRHGTEKAKGKTLVYFDADGDIPVSECFRLIEKHQSRDHTHILIGSKRAKPDSVKNFTFPLRKIGSSLGNFLIQFLLLRGIKDTQAGLKILPTKPTRDLATQTIMNAWSYDIELLALARRAGIEIVEEPIDWQMGRKSHVRWWSYFQTLKDLFLIASRVWMRKYRIQAHQ